MQQHSIGAPTPSPGSVEKVEEAIRTLRTKLHGVVTRLEGHLDCWKMALIKRDGLEHAFGCELEDLQRLANDEAQTVLAQAMVNMPELPDALPPDFWGPVPN